jgi:hypothetical protein
MLARTCRSMLLYRSAIPTVVALSVVAAAAAAAPAVPLLLPPAAALEPLWSIEGAA